MIIILTFIAFTGLVALISWYKTKEENLSTKEGYFLAGRGLTGLVIAGSLEMTNLSTEQLVGQAGQSYSTNMGAMSWSVNASIALLALALIFLPKYLKAGITTIPEFLEVRFDRTTKQIISFLFLLGYMLTYLPTVLYSGALAFNQIFHLDQLLGITTYQSIAILCVAIGVIGSIYAIFGGLKAVAVSDTINGIGLIIGGLMIPFLGFAALSAATGGHGIMDGIKYMVEADPAKMNAINAWNAPEPEVPWPLIITGMFFNNLYWWCTNQSFVQRALAAKSLKEGQKGAIYCGFLKTIGFFYLVLPGVIAYHLPSIQDKLAAAGSSAIDFAYPALVSAVVPKPVMGFFAAVMFGAILSSFNSVLNSVNTMFTMDIYKEFINKNASESKLVSVGKNIGIVFAIFSVIVGPMVYFFPAGLKTFLDSFVMLVGLPVLSGVFGGFFFNCLPKYSARFIMVFHIICYGGFMLLSPSYSLFGGNEGSIHYLYAVSILWPLEMLIMYLMHRRNKSKGAEVWVQQDVGAVDLTPWKYSKLVSVIVIVCVLLVYLAFSPLGIGA